MGYPAFVSSLVVLWLVSFLVGVSFGIIGSILIGILLESVTVFAKAAHRGKSVRAKIALKCSQGVGLAFVFFPFLVMQEPIILKLYTLFIIWSVYNIAMGAIRIYETGKTCDACQYKARWSKCPGFKETVMKLYVAGFITE